MRVLTTEEILNLETSSVQAWRPFLPSLFFITHSWHRSRMCSSAVVMVISSLLLLVAMPLNTWCNRQQDSIAKTLACLVSRSVRLYCAMASISSNPTTTFFCARIWKGFLVR
ncbi:predicted protein [Lichtheimia corymbifera JMRC:FSU:9682]|uniref:Uncharacterized protein n=1 Tax=Lichtheimia corymbifera JMRC:FSU:9682 TaxID=1263082 RepID=A0A068RF11_9FUNG|nr:predicted protein [Lichtheimia corymbifera JMRC:FSU:9682]